MHTCIIVPARPLKSHRRWTSMHEIAKFSGLCPGISKEGSQHPPRSPAARALILQMSVFVTKFNFYLKNGHC